MMVDNLGAVPRVSIITPFLNGEEFMDETISCVLEQTCRSWELLLVDDGSTDSSSELARKYAERYPNKIRYLEHSGHANLGQSPSRNLAIHHAHGEFIAFLDVDDYWLPEKLQRQVDIFDNHSDVAMVYSPYFLWYSWTGRPEDLHRDIRGEIGNGKSYNRVVEPPQMLLQHILHENGLPAPVSAMVRRNIIDRTGGFELAFPGMYDDEAFFGKIALNYSVFVISECLDRYRQHENSFCARAIRDGYWERDPTIPSPDRVRLVRWLFDYVQEHGRFQKTELLAALCGKMQRLGIEDNVQRISVNGK